MNVDALRNRYNSDSVERLLRLAVSGGDVDKRINKVMRGLARSGATGARLRDEIRGARKALKLANSNGSVGRIVRLAEWARAYGSPELTAVLCALAVNMRNELGSEVDRDDAADLANIIGALASDLHDFDIAADQFNRALESARQTGNRNAEASFLLNLSNLMWSLGDNTQAERLAFQALALGEELQDDYRQLQLLFTLGQLAIDRGDVVVAGQFLKRAQPLSKRARDSGLTASFHHLNGLIATNRGDFQGAESAWKRSLAAARRAGDRDKEVACLQNLAAVAHDRGNDGLALRRTRAATEAATEYGHLSRLTALLPMLVRAEANHGSKVQAVVAARRLVETSAVMNTGIGESHALLGATLIDAEELKEGLIELELAWQILDGDESAEADAVRPHLVHNLIVAHAQAGTLAQAWPLLAERAGGLERFTAADNLQGLGLSMLGEQPEIDQGYSAEVLLRAVKLLPHAERAWRAATLAAQASAEGADRAAVDLLRLSLRIAARRKQETTMRHIRNDLALALTRRHQYARARTLLNTNLRNSIPDDDLRTQWLSLFNIAELSRRSDKRGDAEQYARQALAVALNSNDPGSVHDSRFQLGMTLSDLERYDEATHELSAVLDGADPKSSQYAGAAHSLANIALGKDDLESALSLYRTALQNETRDSLQYLEALLGYAEALAAAGRRRTFNGVFQRVINLFDHIAYDGELAVRITRIARRWARRNKPKFAGEVLAVALVLPAAVGQQRFREGHTDADESVVNEALLAVATELHYQGRPGSSGDRRQLIDAMQEEIGRITNASAGKAATAAVLRVLAMLESIS